MLPRLDSWAGRYHEPLSVPCIAFFFAFGLGYGACQDLVSGEVSTYAEVDQGVHRLHERVGCNQLHSHTGMAPTVGQHDNRYKQQMLPRNHARLLNSILAQSRPRQHVRFRTLHTTLRCQAEQSPFSTVNDAEIAHFSRLSALWWDERGEFALLHKMNPHRMRFIREKLLHNDDAAKTRFSELDVLDVGCGGCILSEVKLCPTATYCCFWLTCLDTDRALRA